jgi:hypothetical protein
MKEQPLVYPFLFKFSSGKVLLVRAIIIDDMAVFEFNEPGLAEDYYKKMKKYNKNIKYDQESTNIIEKFPHKSKHEILKILKAEMDSNPKK